MAISPWIDSASEESPDGRYVAMFDQAVEIAMGGPTAGRLVVRLRESGARVAGFTDAGPSFVWAADSSALAFPHWTVDRTQRISILSVPGVKLKTLEAQYSVLQLQSFADGIIVGIDSPIHYPREIRVSASLAL
jgi:hypothetical protein